MFYSILAVLFLINLFHSFCKTNQTNHLPFFGNATITVAFLVSSVFVFGTNAAGFSLCFSLGFLRRMLSYGLTRCVSCLKVFSSATKSFVEYLSVEQLLLVHTLSAVNKQCWDKSTLCSLLATFCYLHSTISHLFGCDNRMNTELQSAQ